MSTGNILVVDDEPQIRRVMRSALTKQGYMVADARNGEEALEKLRDERYDLTGISFLTFRRLRVYPRLSATELNLSSIGIIGSELPIQKSCKPVLAASGTGFFRHRALRCLSWDRFLGCLATTGSSILWGS
jgi:hypothetical protein